jgi:hypothetical protein
MPLVPVGVLDSSHMSVFAHIEEVLESMHKQILFLLVHWRDAHWRSTRSVGHGINGESRSTGGPIFHLLVVALLLTMFNWRLESLTSHSPESSTNSRGQLLLKNILEKWCIYA